MILLSIPATLSAFKEKYVPGTSGPEISLGGSSMRRIDVGFFKTCVYMAFLFYISFSLSCFFPKKNVVSRIPRAHSHLQYM